MAETESSDKFADFLLAEHAHICDSLVNALLVGALTADMATLLPQPSSMRPSIFIGAIGCVAAVAARAALSAYGNSRYTLTMNKKKSRYGA